MKQYRACIVGLTGIGSGHPLTGGEDGYGTTVPHSHAAAYAFGVVVFSLNSSSSADYRT